LIHFGIVLNKSKEEIEMGVADSDAWIFRTDYNYNFFLSLKFFLTNTFFLYIKFS